MLTRTNPSSEKDGQALVIGSSMAGLLAGRILADHVEWVTIVERDRFPEEPLPHKGVPQVRHVYALLKRSRDTLERLFPGLDELVAVGTVLLDADSQASGRVRQ